MVEAPSRSKKKIKNFLNDQCYLYNPNGKCNCRIKAHVEDVNLKNEFQKIKKTIKKINFFQINERVLPKKNYWEK